MIANQNGQSTDEDKAMNSARFQLRMQRTIAEAKPREKFVAVNGQSGLDRHGRIYGEEYELIVNQPGGLL